MKNIAEKVNATLDMDRYMTLRVYVADRYLCIGNSEVDGFPAYLVADERKLTKNEMLRAANEEIISKLDACGRCEGWQLGFLCPSHKKERDEIVEKLRE